MLFEETRQNSARQLVENGMHPFSQKRQEYEDLHLLCPQAISLGLEKGLDI
jgi:hypothetical protein